MTTEELYWSRWWSITSNFPALVLPGDRRIVTYDLLPVRSLLPLQSKTVVFEVEDGTDLTTRSSTATSRQGKTTHAVDEHVTAISTIRTCSLPSRVKSAHQLLSIVVIIIITASSDPERSVTRLYQTFRTVPTVQTSAIITSIKLLYVHY